VTITVTPNAVPPGGTITVTISGTALNVTFTIVLDSTPVTLGTITTNAAGNASAAFTVPASTPPGAHTVVATDNADPSVSASTGLTVLAVAAPVTPTPSSTIPVTGAEVGGIIMLGAAAIGAGGFLVLAARRRRRNSWNSPGM
jgi:LPXTG-motif cell wall-anchored protein